MWILYNSCVTAKEDLRDFIAELTEEQAAYWLQQIERGGEDILASAGASSAEPILARAPRNGSLAELFAAWRLEGPTMSEAQWDEFAAAFDADRPHRPLFT